MTTTSGESHRIYWQQWTTSSTTPTSRRECITSSAAVRISQAAQAHDVTNLLRQTLDLSASNSEQDDSLVLVGTLYSLPKHHVQFEHEQKSQQQQSTTPQEVFVPFPYATLTTDPFHVVYTLTSSDNCLECRKRMMQRLSRLQQYAVGRNIIAPKLQWYYVPSADTTSIPNCIDLDGYATAMEEEESNNDNDSDSDSDKQDSDHDDEDERQDPWIARFPWLDTTQQAHGDDDRYRRQYRREQRRHQELSSSCRPLHTVSGYLLKRDRHDPHVWRRMYCTLTDDYLWYTSRIYTHDCYQFARHGRLRLARALLLEPASDYAPLYRTPFAFEVVTARGTSHIFRATSKSIQVEWIQAISERIVESYENSLLEHAELIVADECLARNRRRTSVAVEPFSSLTKEVGPVLRWGMEVAEYRECCRHVQWALPAKEPVVVVTTPPRKQSSSFSSPPPLDPALQDMIRATWEQASVLLTKATQVALQIQPNRKHNSIETLCRHIDYVITGRFRSSEENSKVEHNDPPPMDLFDPLLAELQSLASSSETPACNGHTHATNGTH